MDTERSVSEVTSALIQRQAPKFPWSFSHAACHVNTSPQHTRCLNPSTMRSRPQDPVLWARLCTVEHIAASLPATHSVPQHLPSRGNQKCLQTLPYVMVMREGESSPLPPHPPLRPTMPEAWSLLPLLCTWAIGRHV